jgi:ABC-type uncharacterized transport system ATPase subunit
VKIAEVGYNQTMQTVLELQKITKRFPGVLANDQISLTLQQGEIHALLGENGAGKSTLMNILYGLYPPDSGQILVRGKAVRVKSPKDAIAVGIGMVHQHFMLVPVFTVTENVMLGAEALRTTGLLDRAKVADQIRQISQQFGLQVDPNATVGDLAVGVQQRVEIIKLLYRSASILIFDEPTAVLTPQESDSLFQVMRSLTAQGKSIIFITHKLREVLTYADRITVIRRGQVVGTADPHTGTPDMLAEMMVGRSVQLQVAKPPPKVGDPVLRVQAITVLNDQQQVALNDVSLEVRAGEVLGIAGVQGNGQTELAQAIAGLRVVQHGHIYLLDKEITHATPRQITASGLGHVPEDRQRDGLVLSFPLTDNIALQTYYEPPFSQQGVLQQPAILAQTQQLIQQFDIRTPSAQTLAGTLSGGNQQKVIIAREFSRPVRLLLVSQPTRGLDVGSIEYIHAQILKKRAAGCAVLLLSTELDEILKLSDQIAVLFQGKIVAMVSGDTSKEHLGLLMAGHVLKQTSLPESNQQPTKREPNA